LQSSAWRWCALAGLIALAVAVAMLTVPDMVPCGPPRGTQAVVVLELARSPAEVAALFGAEPCSERSVVAQRKALWLNMLGFIPAYAVFLLLGIVALRRLNLGLALVAFQLVTIAVTLDGLSGVIQFHILRQLPGTERLLTGLFWTARPKFALLGLAEVAIALLLWRGGALAKMASRATMGGAAVSLTLLFVKPHDPKMVQAHAIAWLALLAFAIVATIRPGLLTRESLWPGAKPASKQDGTD
jgi:hypothetical protein